MKNKIIDIRSIISQSIHIAECKKWEILNKLRLSNYQATKIAYIVENKAWSIHWDGKYITDGINQYINRDIASISCKPAKPQNSIVHFGSQYMWESWQPGLSKNNKYVVTFFHGKREDSGQINKHIDNFIKSSNKLDRVVTAASLIEKRLIEWGIPQDKVVRIPLGVDTSVFTRFSEELKEKTREKLGIPKDKFVIGSFQKDGNGWGEGLIPKLIKGPDIFLDVIKKLKNKLPVHVLLTGPARGYVIQGLRDMGVSYSHIFLENYLELPEYYNALDVYLVTSREEGGPKAILESMATGVPIISTQVGMAEDVIKNSENGFLVNIADVQSIAECVYSLYENPVKKLQMIENANSTISAYDWQKISVEYFDKVYSGLL